MGQPQSTQIINAKAFKRMRRSLREKCQMIGIPLESEYRTIEHNAKMVRAPMSNLHPSGYMSLVPVQRVLANCFRNEAKSMKAIGRSLFGASAQVAR